MENPTFFYSPSTNLIGAGCLSNLSKELTSRGYKKGLIVTDQNLVKLGQVRKVEQILKDSKIEYTLFDEIEFPNPNVTVVEKGSKQLQGCDCVISIGGGTNHDTARSIAALATNGGSITNYEGQNKFTKPILPWIAINTLAGSGAHVSMVDVVIDDSRKIKMCMIDAKTLATLTVDDPTLHVTAPKEPTISAGIDVLVHSAEAYIARNANIYTDALALKAIQLVVANLPKLSVNGNDLEARDNMAIAGMMAGTAFNNAGLGYAHSIAHQVGGASYRHHGLTCAVLLPFVLRFNAEVVPVQKYIDLAIAMGQTAVNDQNAINTVISAIQKLYDILEIPDNLGEMGAQEADVKYYAEMALKDIISQSNPRQANLDEMMNLIKQAMSPLAVTV